MRLTCTPASTPCFLVEIGSGRAWPSGMGVVVVATAAAAPSASPCSAEASQPLSMSYIGPRWNDWSMVVSVEVRSSRLTPGPACACACSCGAPGGPTTAWMLMPFRCVGDAAAPDGVGVRPVGLPCDGGGAAKPEYPDARGEDEKRAASYECAPWGDGPRGAGAGWW